MPLLLSQRRRDFLSISIAGDNSLQHFGRGCGIAAGQNRPNPSSRRIIPTSVSVCTLSAQLFSEQQQGRVIVTYSGSVVVLPALLLAPGWAPIRTGSLIYLQWSP